MDGFDPQDQLDPARPTYQLEGQFGKKNLVFIDGCGHVFCP